MVYLLKMVIFHGYVSHNQMVNPWFMGEITPETPEPQPRVVGWSIPCIFFPRLVWGSGNGLRNHGVLPWRQASQSFNWLVVLTMLKNISQWEGLCIWFRKQQMNETTNQFNMPPFMIKMNSNYHWPMLSPVLLITLWQFMGETTHKKMFLVDQHQQSVYHGLPHLAEW